LANLIDFSPLSCIEPVLIVEAWHPLKDIHNKKKKASLNLHETRRLKNYVYSSSALTSCGNWSGRAERAFPFFRCTRNLPGVATF
jgi:hypothetical protein